MLDSPVEGPHPSPYFRVKRALKAILAILVALQSGLIILFFVLQALSGSTLPIVDAVGYILPWLFLPSVFLVPLAVVSRSRAIIAVAAIPPLSFIFTYGRLFLPNAPSDEASDPFTVMIHNVHDLNEEYQEVGRQIEARDPDILGLHELEPHMLDRLDDTYLATYPYKSVEPGRGLFSRFPIEQTEVFRLGTDGHWAQEVVMNVDGRRLTLLNIHIRSARLEYDGPLGMPSGFDREDRDRDLADLISRINEIEGPLIVMGDLNMSDRQDQYREIGLRLLDAHAEKGWGLGFTRTNYPRTGIPSWRIDYIFYSPDLEAVSVVVGKYAGSDHKPVIAQVHFSGET